MSKPKPISEKPINAVELKAELELIKKRDKVLSPRALKTEDYLSQFVVLSEKEAEELKAKLYGLNITRLKPEYIIKIIDLMPASVEELKTILQGYVVSINNEDMRKVIDLVNEFTKKPKK